LSNAFAKHDTVSGHACNANSQKGFLGWGNPKKVWEQFMIMRGDGESLLVALQQHEGQSELS